MDDVNFDEFLLDKEAYWPPMPCAYCRRNRLQCFILRTTAANPNPVSSCSSCVALFRECTLAGQGKRGHSSFETSEPVIGHLHGLSEEYLIEEPFPNGASVPGELALGEFAFGEAAAPFMPAVAPSASSSSSILPATSCKRASSRSVHKTRALRHWFAANMDHPYPSDEIKDSLAQQSGMRKSQVINWFVNARRRYRLSLRASTQSSSQHHPQGSPRPRSLLSSSPTTTTATANQGPFERWRNSPPDDEPVDPAAIERALEAFLSDNSDYFEPTGAGGDHFDGSTSSASGDLNFDELVSSDSNSSSYSFHSAMSSFSMARSAQSSDDGRGNNDDRSGRSTGAPLYQCTFCLETFRKKFDWSRHEQSVHLPGLHSWVCGVPLAPDAPLVLLRAGQQQEQQMIYDCVFCGHAAPDVHHFQTHQFEECAERAEVARTFSRKDHLVQHLRKFHGCRRREGWAMDVAMLRRTQDAVASRCGFCGLRMGRWEQRVQHLAAHFRAGLTMEQWEGGCGIEGGMAAMVQGDCLRGTESPLMFDMAEVDIGGNAQG